MDRYEKEALYRRMAMMEEFFRVCLAKNVHPKYGMLSMNQDGNDFVFYFGNKPHIGIKVSEENVSEDVMEVMKDYSNRLIKEIEANEVKNDN